MIFVKHQAVGERASKRQSRGLAMSDECMDKKNESRVQREVESGGGTLVEGSKAEEELAHKQGCSREESNMTLLCRVQKRGQGMEEEDGVKQVSKKCRVLRGGAI